MYFSPTLFPSSDGSKVSVGVGVALSEVLSGVGVASAEVASVLGAVGRGAGALASVSLDSDGEGRGVRSLPRLTPRLTSL